MTAVGSALAPDVAQYLKEHGVNEALQAREDVKLLEDKLRVLERD